MAVHWGLDSLNNQSAAGYDATQTCPVTLTQSLFTLLDRKLPFTLCKVGSHE